MPYTKTVFIEGTAPGVSAAELNKIGTGIEEAAPLASPAFTGVPTAPTAVAGTNTTQLATTAFVTTAAPTHNGSQVEDAMITKVDYDRFIDETNNSPTSGAQGSLIHSGARTIPFNEQAADIFVPSWVTAVQVTFTNTTDKNKSITVLIGRSASHWHAWGFHSVAGYRSFAGKETGNITSTATTGGFPGFGTGVFDDQAIAILLSLKLEMVSGLRKLQWNIASLGGSGSTNLQYEAIWVAF